ncbi:glucose dehydrogenase [FAD, quinone]-like [Spodoptera litura]|uniref:Glucose dehydrogenase [FAD, quinone]-like n=1 Tax=Spodoptera litura TaxID=69820 RepID=A0A9J7EPC7_SPOLT|nr:glucose dehydrogenase [FAD, quinone]-like [Spodoptera litura]
MEHITNAASSDAYTSSVQNALSVLTTLHITSYMWMPETDVKDSADAEYEYIVVGAGTAGAIVAGRLAQSQARVLLIEAGGDPPIETIYAGLALYARWSEIDYNFTVHTQPYNQQCREEPYFTLHAGKVLGGTSSTNTMLYARGNKQDFQRWVTASNDDSWSWENVLKYFKRTEKMEDPAILNSPYRQYHGLDGPLIVTRENRSRVVAYPNLVQQLGGKVILDLNSNETLGYSRAQYTLKDYRQSTATAFLKASDTSPYLHLLKNTEVTKIIFDDNNRAVGVKAKRNNKMYNFNASKEVILSAGVINSPKLLMLSGIGPKEHLECKGIEVKVNLPVGKNYHDHVGVMIAHRLRKSNESAMDVDVRVYPTIPIIAYVAINESNKYPDYVLTGFFIYGDDAAKLPLQENAFIDRYCSCIRNTLYRESKGYNVLYSFIDNPMPKSRGTVTLRSSHYKDQPIIDGEFFTVEDDLENHIDYLQRYIKVQDTEAFQSIGAKFLNPVEKKCGRYEMGSRKFWRCYIMCMMSPRNHAVGTCAMGSVVDSKLRVLGVQGLRVADASIIPVIPSVGTYAPTMMIGEKAASMIIEDNM